MRCRRVSITAAAAAAGPALGRHGELAEARVSAAASGDERDVQLVVQILSAEKCGGAGDDARRRQGTGADELSTRHSTRARLLRPLARRLLHGVLLAPFSEPEKPVRPL